jgi:hypothetical protein
MGAIVVAALHLVAIYLVATGQLWDFARSFL